MAKNFVQSGNVLTLAAPYDRTSGQGALIGALFGVALGDVLNGKTGDFDVTGVWDLDKTNAQAWTVGERIYWDDANKRCDSDPTKGVFIGRATQVAANPSATGRVLLNEAGFAFATGATADVPDVATANAVDLATAEALANQLKVTVNALLDGLRTAGIIQ